MPSKYLSKTALERAETAKVELQHGLELRVRAPLEVDFKYISSTWLHGFRHASPNRHIGNTVYFGYEHRRIEHLWNTATWLVGTSANDPAFILGYVCVEGSDVGPVVHWVYTRSELRRSGVAKALLALATTGLPEGPFWYTRFTPEGLACLRVRSFGGLTEEREGWEYNPYLAGGMGP